MKRIDPPAVSTFDHIESLEQIKPPYPAQYSADWHALRRRVEIIIHRKQAKHPPRWTADPVAHYKAAMRLAAGDDSAQLDYERDGKSAEWWIGKWNPAGKRRNAIPSADEILR